MYKGAVRHWCRLLLLLLLASLAGPLSAQPAPAQAAPAPEPVPAPASAPVPVPAAQATSCGPMDVVFAVETTNGTGIPREGVSILDNFKSNFSQDVEGGIGATMQRLSNDLRLGLVTFTDTVTVRQELTADVSSVESEVSALEATDSAKAPEASDDALETIINLTTWRSGVTRMVVLIVDDGLPGGDDDFYTVPTSGSLGPDETNVREVAAAARDKGIILTSVAFPLPLSLYKTTGRNVLLRYADTSGGVALTASSADTVARTIISVLNKCGRRGDVRMRDTPSDIGVEPLPASVALWGSPDIRVCEPQGCTGSQDPIFGRTNYVYVTLRNDGPKAVPPRPVSGTLRIYYVGSGGAARWAPGTTAHDWVEIGSADVEMNANETKEVEVLWEDLPNPGHYCLLARWESDDDPMIPEGIDTLTNTRNNNNIIWRNVNVISLPRSSSETRSFVVRNVANTPVAMDLAIVPSGVSFLSQGTIELDLGTQLFNGWDQGGRQGTNVTAIGGTRVRITGTSGGELRYIVMGSLANSTASVRFATTSTAQFRQYTIDMVQYVQGPSARTMTGGNTYQINVTP